MTLTKFTQLIIAVAAAGALGMSVYNAFQINEVHINVNSRLTELLDVTRKSAEARGLKQGREENR